MLADPAPARLGHECLRPPASHFVHQLSTALNETWNTAATSSRVRPATNAATARSRRASCADGDNCRASPTSSFTQGSTTQNTHRFGSIVLNEFRNYQQCILPAGPGARSLAEFFASIDEKLDPAAVTASKIQRNDRDVLNLLSKRAKVLHLGPANYCWFTDPSRALCLKLAGTPTADRPLIGMCDSARCPQATHHPCHRPVWAEHAKRTETFIGQLGATRKTERTRLQADHGRALRVVAEIDAASTRNEESA